jgi:hypothetical protein
MCRRTIVGLLMVGIVCGVSLPAAANPSVVELKAHDPNPPNGACGVTGSLLSWTAGTTAVRHDLYLGTTPALGPANWVASSSFTMFWVGFLEWGRTYYWRVNEVESDGVTVHTGDLWCFTFGTCSGSGIINLCCDPLLIWPPVPGAVAYHVYFSDNQSEVAARAPAADKGTTDQTALSLGSLQDETVYYWVVDAIMANGEYLGGSIQGCTVPACPAGGVLREWWLDISGTSVSDLTSNPAYAGPPNGQECLDGFEGPTDWADNYGTRLSAWLLPPVSGAYTFWIAGDDNAELWLEQSGVLELIASVPGWTQAREWDKYPEQKSAPQLLSGGKKYYIQALMKEGGGGDNIAVAWQGPGMLERKVICVPYVESSVCTPFIAYGPYPRDGDPYVDPTPVLRWHAGREAVQHDVYFSDDFELVAWACQCACAAYGGRQTGTTYNPGPLVPGRRYYWRVDEINDANPASPWRGCVWSFTVADDCRILLENFEGYTDFDPIQGHWEGTPNPVTLEQTIAHGGGQSMRLNFDNTVSPYQSEAWPSVLPLTDWTTSGASSLCLWVHGGPPRFQQTAEDCYRMSGAGTDIWNNTDEFRYAYKQLTGDGSIAARVQSIDNTNSWAKAGVMIRASLDPGSPHAMVVVTPGNGVSFQRRLLAGGSSEDTTLPGPQAPYWVRLTRTGDTLAAAHSLTGVDPWADLGTVTLPMSASVYIGLAVTSHNPDAVAVARFCPVAMTEDVTGPWHIADIGVAQPGNVPCPLYISVEDTAGHHAVALHPDPSVMVSDDWQKWCIPLDAFTGVNPAHLKKVAIGVGDPLDPSPGCAGWIYIDDICLR